MTYNPYILIPFVTWVIAQLIKFALKALGGRLDFKYLYASGSMPSAHSAVVCALAVTALLREGMGSTFFGLTVILAGIVMYDSFGVRRASGEQAAALNMLIESLDNDRIKLRNPELKLREILGHTPLEVGVGAALGLLLGALFNLSRLSDQLQFLASDPVPHEFTAYLAFFVLILFGGFVAKYYARQRFGESAAVKAFVKKLFLATQVSGWIGLVFSFGQYEHLPYFSWRVWSWLVLIVLLIWDAWLVSLYQRVIPPALVKERESARRKKWLQPKKRKKK